MLIRIRKLTGLRIWAKDFIGFFSFALLINPFLFLLFLFLFFGVLYLIKDSFRFTDIKLYSRNPEEETDLCFKWG